MFFVIPIITTLRSYLHLYTIFRRRFNLMIQSAPVIMLTLDVD